MLLVELLKDEDFSKAILAFLDCLLEVPYKLKRKFKNHRLNIKITIEKEQVHGKKK